MSVNTAADPELQRFAEGVGADGPVAVEGARTRWRRGGPLADGTRLVKAPTGVVAFEPAEMTVRVRAGTLVRDLNEALADAGQRTALPDRGGTVGGALAVGEDDVGVLGVGRVRAALLQVRYASADGRLVTGGGPTVKNVSGFDLPRLLVGSLGTLGLICDVVLRTNPVPDASVWLVTDEADPMATRAASVRPGAVLWDGSRTWLLLEGRSPDVDAQRASLAKLARFQEVEAGPELPAHRWSFRPSDLDRLPVESLGEGYVASIGTGTVFSHRERPQPVFEPAAEELHDRIKAEFDPHGRLNPGRDPRVI